MSYGTDEPTQHQYPTGYLGAPPSSSTPTPAYRVGPPPQVGPQEYSTGHFTPPQSFPPAPPRRKKRSRTPELVAVAVVVLIALGIVGAFAYAKTRDPATTRAAAAAATTPASCDHGRIGNGQCAAANDPTPTAPEKSYFKMPVGTTLGAEAGDGSVIEAVVTKVTTSKSGCGGTLKSQNGTYLIADVTVTIKTGTASINPLYFEFVDTKGATETMTGGIFAGCQSLDSGNDISAPATRTGQVVFDVANPHGEIVFNDASTHPLGSWLVG